MSSDQVIPKSESQIHPRKEQAIEALSRIIETSGFEADDLQVALEAIQAAKELQEKKEKETDGFKFCLNRTLVYDDLDAFIYQRADTVTGRWYFSFWDTKSSKPVRKALKTADKVQALTRARMLYIDIKGKIDRGERLKAINTIELLRLWDKKVKSQLTDIHHEGITHGRYKVIYQHMRHWREYMESLGLLKTPIDLSLIHI